MRGHYGTPKSGHVLNLAAMPDVVVTETMDSGAVALMREKLEVSYQPDLHADPKLLRDVAASARALVVRNQTQVDQELLEHCPTLEIVGRLGVGLDNIDTGACEQRGIDVVPATGTNAIAVAEYVIAAILILFRAAFGATSRVVAGEWPRQHLVGREVSGKELGLIGLGSIAREVASRAHALGMKVMAYDPYLTAESPAWELASRAELDDVIRGSDAISVHVPLDESTRHLIDRSALESMRQGSVLVNTSRGGIVDEEALVDALTSGHLGGAALDVFDSEPLDSASGQRFSDLPNLLLTPHIAGITAESNIRTGRVIAEAVLARLGE